MGSGAPPWRQAAGRDTHPLLAAKDAVLAELGPEAVVHPEFDDLGVLAATLPETTAENLLSLAVAEDPVHHLFAQTVPYGFGIVQVKEGVDALTDGVDQYDPATGNGDGNNPANVECPETVEGGARANGGGNVDVGTSGGGSDSGSGDSASTLILDPNLRDEGVPGSLQVFTVRSFGPDLEPLAGAVVSVARTGSSSVHTRSRRAPLGAPERGTMGRTAAALSGGARGEGAGCGRCG